MDKQHELAVSDKSILAASCLNEAQPNPTKIIHEHKTNAAWEAVRKHATCLSPEPIYNGLTMKRCDWDTTGRPFIWLEAPGLLGEEFPAIVDTGFDSFVILPKHLIRPVTYDDVGGVTPYGSSKRLVGRLSTAIRFNGLTRTLQCHVMNHPYAVVGMLFLREFGLTLIVENSPRTRRAILFTEDAAPDVWSEVMNAFTQYTIARGGQVGNQDMPPLVPK